MNNKELREQLQKTIDSLERNELRMQSQIVEWGEWMNWKQLEELEADKKQLRALEYKGYELLAMIPQNEKVQLWLNACISVYQLQVMPMMFK